MKHFFMHSLFQRNYRQFKWKKYFRATSQNENKSNYRCEVDNSSEGEEWRKVNNGIRKGSRVISSYYKFHIFTTNGQTNKWNIEIEYIHTARMESVYRNRQRRRRRLMNVCVLNTSNYIQWAKAGAGINATLNHMHQCEMCANELMKLRRNDVKSFSMSALSKTECYAKESWWY